MFTMEEYARHLELIERARRCMPLVEEKTKARILVECKDRHLDPGFPPSFISFRECIAVKILEYCQG